MPFPIPFVPVASYHTGARRFGADRAKGRKHAGCDLIAPVGTPIFAVEDGVVVEWDRNKEFYHRTFALVVQHRQFLARYCEIRGVATGIGRGSIIKAGEHIADVGKMFIDSMLHLEIYSKPYAAGPLTNRKNAPFQRRADLQNPTPFLDRLADDLPSLEK